MTLLEAALACPQCLVSVMGDHAGEGADAEPGTLLRSLRCS
jgi:hypothetical protein